MDQDNVFFHTTVQQALRRGFFGWQCRLRQHAVRQDGGRPGDGMRPSVVLDGGEQAIARVTLLIVPAEPGESTSQLRHMARRTEDPAERLAAVLHFLSSNYFQHPADFADELTGLFGARSALADRLGGDAACTLVFEQFAQRFTLPCKVRELPQAHPWFEATFWHNKLFNADLPGDARVLGFQPDWRRAEADPAVPGST